METGVPLSDLCPRGPGTPARVTRALERVGLTSKTKSELHAPRPEHERSPHECPEASLPPSPSLAVRSGVPFMEKTPRFHERVRSGKGPVGSGAAAGFWTALENDWEGLSFIRKNKTCLTVSHFPVRPSACPSVHLTASWALSAPSSGRCCSVDLFQGLVLRRLSS